MKEKDEKRYKKVEWYMCLARGEVRMIQEEAY